MTILDRELLKDLTKTILVILLVLSLATLGMFLTKLLGRVTDGRLPQEILFYFVGLLFISNFFTLIPGAVFFAVLWVFGRMSRDGELTALSAGGVGLLRLYRPVMIVAIPLAAVTLWGNMVVKPWTFVARDDLISAAGQAAQLSGLRPGAFHSFRGDRLVMYSGELDEAGKALRWIMVSEKRDGKQGVVFAREAGQFENERGERFITLSSGERYEALLVGKEPARGTFDSYAYRIPSLDKKIKKKSIKALPWYQLMASDDLNAVKHFHLRLVDAFGLIALVLVSVPLARFGVRRDPFPRIGAAVAIYLVYRGLQDLGADWIGHITPTWMGLFWLPLLLVLVAVLLTHPPRLPRIGR